MIDVCQYIKSDLLFDVDTSLTILVFNFPLCLVLLRLKILLSVLNVWEPPISFSFLRCVGVIIPLIILVSPLVKTVYFFFQDNVGYQFNGDLFQTTIVFTSNKLCITLVVVSLTTIMFTSNELLIMLIVVVLVFLTSEIDIFYMCHIVCF